ncbi:MULTISPECIES: polyphosphate kinase 1 [Sorangium]|uniref:Polyphosphate kinase n=1 Tax=Sorangium cellulosum TaxID=56 RepID=A0A4V0NFC4_SORCE|nr:MULTISPECIES: polyphosphate kinase 1 [Sorangium]AUX29182.1 polyphosphate kinase [Sorangium cellulosum]WCQ88574.1 Polyphosphate kinase [Sorangium sp. Soce836]
MIDLPSSTDTTFGSGPGGDSDTAQADRPGAGSGDSAGARSGASAAPASGPVSIPAASGPAAAGPIPIEGDPNHYLNRELSWLEFNARVLAEARSHEVPLFERLKFLSIFFSNLDEFFMVRVAGLQAQTQRTIAEVPPDGLTPHEQLVAIGARVHALVDDAYQLWNSDLIPALQRAGIVIVKPDELGPTELSALDDRFRTDIFPILTPIAIDPGHPFPHLRNKMINLGIMFSREHEAQEPGFAVIQVPPMLSRLMKVRVEGATRAFVLLEDVIARHVKDFFPSGRLRGTYPFRVTRNWDLEIDEEEGEDLLETIQAELRRRDRGNAVRLEIGIGEGAGTSVQRLCRALKVDASLAVYRVPGPLHIADLMGIVAEDERREYRDEPFSPQVPPLFRDVEDVFAVIREQDVLLHHPYESFDPIAEFVSRAADDPNVLAIKQTLYRTGGDSPILKALARAAESGKQVTAIVELKARFDEASNIQWARTLEQSGVQVIYGLLGLKTHAKALLVVRREKDKLRRYVHLSTGNYNPQTARLYTDIGLFTANREIGEDMTSLFNLLTGYSAPPKWNRLIVAPLGLHEAVLGLIAREAAHARAGRKAEIVAQMNALVDVDVIDALYAASQAGVDIKLAVRGICCLRPGIPGLSERIQVRAIIDRFLEHKRLFRFANGGNEEVYMSSADWMPRNFHRRVELMVPIIEPAIRSRVDDMLNTVTSDTAKTWELASDGSYHKLQVPSGAPQLRSQQRFIELARERVKLSDPLARGGGRFHILRMPASAPDGESRHRKGGKKKKGLS